MLVKKVAHLTSVHSRNDTRIYLKECCSLAKAGYEVTLIVADGKKDEYINGVKIQDVGKLNGRINRMFTTTKAIFNAAVKLDALIYHLHDPELIPIGLKLKKLGKIVIFDSHEDLPKQILGKPYLNMFVRIIISSLIAYYEKFACKKFSAIVTATPFIRDKFLRINTNTIDINNFPILGELDTEQSSINKNTNKICYVGGITQIRGITEVVNAMEKTTSGTRLQLVGNFGEPAVERNVKNLSGWNNVDELGFLNRIQVKELLAESILGLVTFLPFQNHIDAQPNKMFEYMSAGVPVVSSNFPLWREIIEGNECGICIDPLDSTAIANAIDTIANDPVLAKKMGENGKKAVLSTFNWDNEEQKLLELYENLQVTQTK